MSLTKNQMKKGCRKRFIEHYKYTKESVDEYLNSDLASEWIDSYDGDDDENDEAIKQTCTAMLMDNFNPTTQEDAEKEEIRLIKELKELLDNFKDEEAVNWCYKHQNGASKAVYKNIVECYEELADRGVGLAANNLGSMYYNGEYVKQDYEQAIKYYTIAANLGETLAYGNLGCCYIYGFKNNELQYKWFSEGAYLFNNPECLFRLGDMYRDGRVVEFSEVKAMHLYNKALACINKDEWWQYVLKPDILKRIGELDLHGSIVNPLDALSALNTSLEYYYEIKDRDRWASKEIGKVKPLIKEAIDMLDKKNKLN